MRADKKRNIDKVAAEIVKNPLATEVEIAKETGLGNGTVHRSIKEVEKNGVPKDERIIHLTDGDYDLQCEILKIKKKKVKENPDGISDSDLNNWERQALARQTLLTGNVTDKSGGLKQQDTKNMTDEQAREALNSLISQGDK